MEARQMGGLFEQRLPMISVLTQWTPACRCRCETKHRSLRGHTPLLQRLGVSRLPGPRGRMEAAPHPPSRHQGRASGGGWQEQQLQPSVPAAAGSGAGGPLLADTGLATSKEEQGETRLRGFLESREPQRPWRAQDQAGLLRSRACSHPPRVRARRQLSRPTQQYPGIVGSRPKHSEK